MTYSSLMENIDNGIQNFRHINLITSVDDGINWSCPIDLTPWDALGELENVFLQEWKEMLMIKLGYFIKS